MTRKCVGYVICKGDSHRLYFDGYHFGTKQDAARWRSLRAVTKVIAQRSWSDVPPMVVRLMRKVQP